MKCDCRPWTFFIRENSQYFSIEINLFLQVLCAILSQVELVKLFSGVSRNIWNARNLHLKGAKNKLNAFIEIYNNVWRNTGIWSICLKHYKTFCQFSIRTDSKVQYKNVIWRLLISQVNLLYSRIEYNIKIFSIIFHTQIKPVCH